ncbi:helix-turn-helix domain-containing protein [Anaeromyxobacter oryzisoli]|uniref:helix-turn-helix domain-containing protein n=1 Tax=Anaeromyxobacter oryzisoli TaxID=2925408 RepID=UPI001F57F61E|nr:helix-turn-helix transcriptional regulator [Anaeromyxobacter sp. SG63]
MTLADIVAHNLRVLRIAAGVPQQVLASRAGVSVSYISMLERGQRIPPLATLESVARALKVDPLSLIQEKALGASRPRKRGRRG